MKLLAMLGVMILVSGCGQKTTEISGNYILPMELKDCKIFVLENGSSRMKVMRCPNSATSVTYTSGKTTVANVVIEGVEYTPINK